MTRTSRNFHSPAGSAEAPGGELMFSVLSAVPIDASDSGVSSSDVRGSKINISYVSSSLVDTHIIRVTGLNLKKKTYYKYAAA